MKPKLNSQKQFKSVARSSLGSLVALLLLAPQAGAVSIKRNFIDTTQIFPGIEKGKLKGGDAPSNAAGKGNLFNIFNAAADWWEATILDDFDLTLNFGWAPLGGKGIHNLVDEGGTPHREKEGTIRFDNDESTEWFLDPTPLLADEYQDFVTDKTDLGGGRLNVERRYTTPVAGSPASGRFDLFQTALHEIGHALGLSGRNDAYLAETKDNKIDVTASRPFVGSDIPVTGPHFTNALNQSLMWGGGLPRNERRTPSAVDILAIAQVSQFEDVRYNPLLATGSIFGEVTESEAFDVDAGDLIRGNYSLNFDASVFSTNQKRVTVPVSDFNLFVGNNLSLPLIGNFFLPKHQLVPRTTTSFIDPNPLALFVREGNAFVFDTLVANLEYSTSEESNIFAELTGGKRLFGESGEGLLFSSGGWTTGTTGIVNGRTVTVEGGITQTCEGNGCRFQVPEPTTTLLMSALALSGGGVFKRKLGKKRQVA